MESTILCSPCFIQTSLDLAKVLDGIYRSNEVISSRLDRQALYRVRLSLERSAGTLDAILAQTLPRGVAFHHAGLSLRCFEMLVELSQLLISGLTAEERECIEDGFRSGVIMVLVATSTLSSGICLLSSSCQAKGEQSSLNCWISGVNLPASRVVIKAQIRGPAAISGTTYKQMSGRSGRLGHVEAGSA